MITDPCRLLPAFTTWHSLQSIGLTPIAFCYIPGCGPATIGPVRHCDGTTVHCCRAHDPRPVDARPATELERPPMARSTPPGDANRDPGQPAPRPTPPRAPAGPADPIDPTAPAGPRAHTEPPARPAPNLIPIPVTRQPAAGSVRRPVEW